MYDAYWNGCYAIEKPYYIGYEGTDLADADSDGDGVRDGADDQDHDDIPNLAELSRIAASGLDDRKNGKDCQAQGGPRWSELHASAAVRSRTARFSSPSRTSSGTLDVARDDRVRRGSHRRHGRPRST